MKMVKSTFSVTLLSFLLISCGDESLRPGQKSFDLNSQTQSSNLNFQTLNSSVAGNLNISGTLRLDGGKLHVDLQADGLTANSKHIQVLYSKSGCPVDADDANNDGFIDFKEAIGSSSVTTPLTSDLTAEGSYPTADEAGKYSYTASADSSLDKESLEGKVIIVHGVDTTQELPETVASDEGLTSHETLPIACSVIAFEDNGGGTTGDTSGSMTSGGQEQTTGHGGKGGYQEQTTGNGGKGGYQEQTTGQQQQQ